MSACILYFVFTILKVFALRGKEPDDLFNVMLKGYKRRSLTGCSIKPDPDVHEAKTDMGLVMGHAYTVSKVVFVKTFSFDTYFSYSQIICVLLIISDIQSFHHNYDRW